MEMIAANDNRFDPSVIERMWEGIAIERLPTTKAAAADVGCAYYFTGDECQMGHVAPRYTSSANCLTCTHMRRARSRPAVPKKGRNAHNDVRTRLVRAIAALSGAKTYVPDNPCLNGHMLRWVGTNNCIECELEKKAGYRDARREARLIKKYDLTAAGFDLMAANQNGCCKICEKPVTDNRAFHVDHNHDTGKVRGLLCSKCNQALGLFNEDVSVMAAAVRYLENAAA